MIGNRFLRTASIVAALLLATVAAAPAQQGAILPAGEVADVEARVVPPAETDAGDAHGTPHYPLEIPERQRWSFAGLFGTYDRGQLQRGFKVYLEACAFCH